MEKSSADLAQEIEALREQLVEAQRVIRAVRLGEVDATLVSGSEREQVHTLKVSEHAYQALAEAMNEGAATLGPDGTVLYCNRRLADLLGIPPEQIIGCPAAQLVGEKSRHRFESLMAEALCGNAVKAELEIYPAQDRGIPVYVSLRGMEGEDSRALCMVVTDLTEQKKSDERLAVEEVRRKQAELLRFSFDAIILWRPGKGIESWNTGAERLYGYTESEALGHSPHELLAMVHPKEWAEIEAELYKNGSWEGELCHHTRDGSSIVVSARKQIVRDADGSDCVLEINRDITARKRAEARLRRFYETDLFAILYWRLDGGVIDVNNKFLEMTGYTHEDLHAGLLNWSHMTPPEYQAMDEDARRQIRETGIHRPYEKEFVRKDGSHVWGLFSGAAWEDNRNEGVSFILDITARKQAEAEIQENRAKLDAAMASMTDAVFISDVDGHLVNFNDAFATFHRFNSKADCARTVAEYPDFLQVFTTKGEPAPLDDWAVPRALRGDTVTNAEYSLLRKDTGESWVGSYSFGPIRDKDDTIVGAVVVARDVTEQKRAEEELRRGEEQFRRVVDHIHDALLVDDAAGKLVFCNHRFLSLFGIDPTSTLPNTLEDYVAPEWRAEVRTRHNSRMRGEAVPSHFEYEGVRQDGKRIWLEVDVVPIRDSEGTLTGTQSVIRDITDRKRAEQALIQSEKLASVGRMASTIAHEINNPLETIGNAVFLAMTDPSSSQQVKTYLELAVQELDRVTHITRQTLAFHRTERQRALIDLRECIEGLLRLFGPRLNSRGISIEKHYAEVDPILATSGEVQQVISNLLTNSMDAMPNHGKIYLRVTRSIWRDGKKGVRFTIADTGVGIPQDRLKKIFQAFFTTKEMVGTGLGLWISQQILENHGARIQVRSKLGHGTVFSILFQSPEAITEPAKRGN